MLSNDKKYNSASLHVELVYILVESTYVCVVVVNATCFPLSIVLPALTVHGENAKVVAGVLTLLFVAAAVAEALATSILVGQFTLISGSIVVSCSCWGCCSCCSVL